MNHVSKTRSMRSRRSISSLLIKLGRCVFAVFAATIGSVSFAVTQVELNCPIVSVPSNVDRHTLACLNDLDEIISLDSDLLETRNSLLWHHDKADQLLVIKSMYSKYCNLLETSNVNRSLPELQSMLMEGQTRLYQRESFAPIIDDSRNESNLPQVYEPGKTFRVRSTDRSNGWAIAQSKADTPLEVPTDASQSTRPHPYLNDSPYVVNTSNKYFVIVASTFSASDAQHEVRRLKLKAPQYDFVAYAPYQDNPAYAIMIATWVSKDVADSALEDARRDVAIDAFVWKCPQKGAIGTC